MTTITFERIGRSHDVPNLVVDDSDDEALMNEIYDYARPHIASRDLEVLYNTESRSGYLLVGGFRNAGSFTLGGE